MKNWYEYTMDCPEVMMEFERKMNEDEDENLERTNFSKISKKGKKNSWVCKNEYRKKKMKKFCFLKPNMALEEIGSFKTHNAIWITEADTNGRVYFINHVNKLFWRRNHVEQFRGVLEWHRNGRILGVCHKNYEKGKILNRRIRQMPLMEDEKCLHYSVYKKMFGPKEYDIL